MKTLKTIFLFLLFSHSLIAQNEPFNLEGLFKKFLETEDTTLARQIVQTHDSVYGLYCLGILATDSTEKINYYTQFIDKKPDFGLSNAYMARGIVHSFSKNYIAAINDLNQSVNLEPQDPYAYYFLGDSYSSLKLYEKAIPNYDKAIELSPNFTLAYYLRGISYYDLSNFTKALGDFNSVLNFDPKYDEAYLMRGLTYDELGQYKLAIADFKQAKKLNKGNAKYTDGFIDADKKKLKEKK